MNVIVTGGAGFVGTNLVVRLKRLGYRIIVIDNFTTGQRANIIEGIQYVEEDLKLIEDFGQWGKIDIVFHLAATARIGPSFNAPADYFKNNAVATLNVVEWCSQNSVPLIFSGSSSKWSGSLKNPYTFSKEVGEQIIALYRKHFNLNCAIARFYNVYGPYQLLDGGYTTLIGRWLNNLRTGQPFVIFGDGEQRRDFTHVDDIIDALVLMVEQRAWGFDFELGRGRNISVNEVAALFGVQPEYAEGKKGEARITLNEDNKALEILGWSASRELADYLKIELGNERS